MKNNGRPRTMTITSGKGGVGKTNVSVNLALQLARLGYRTCLFDADLGLANISILLGLNPEFDLEDVILKRRSLHEITIRDFNGIDIIPGSSGVEMMANLDDEQLRYLAGAMNKMEDYDFMVLDTSAGISKNVIAFCLASTEVLLIITPEPTSMTDAYALLKVLSLNDFRGAAKIIVNQCDNVAAAKKIFHRYQDTVKRYLQLDLILAGIIIKDPKVVQSVKKRQPHLLLYPDSNASKCVKHLTKVLLNQTPDTAGRKSVASFWQRCFHLLKNPVNLGKDREPEVKRSSADPEGEGTDNPVGVEKGKTKHPAKGPESPTGENEREKAPVGSERPPDEPPKNVDAVPITSNRVLPVEDRQDHLPLLTSRLLDHMSSISKELKAIRTVMENGHARNTVPISAAAPGDIPAETIILDFEGFLQRRGIK